MKAKKTNGEKRESKKNKLNHTYSKHCPTHKKKNKGEDGNETVRNKAKKPDDLLGKHQI